MTAGADELVKNDGSSMAASACFTTLLSGAVAAVSADGSQAPRLSRDFSWGGGTQGGKVGRRVEIDRQRGEIDGGDACGVAVEECAGTLFAGEVR